MADIWKLTNRHIERAGLGLVMWNLCRRGVDCQETPPGSHTGDVWAHVAGNLVSIEVKATTGRSWHVRRRQVGTSDWHIFVLVQPGRCWVLTRDDLMKCSASFEKDGDAWFVTPTSLPRACEDAWGPLVRKRAAPPGGAIAPRGKAKYRFRKVVRSVLSDGRIREYHYGPNGNEIRTIIPEQSGGPG